MLYSRYTNGRYHPHAKFLSTIRKHRFHTFAILCDLTQNGNSLLCFPRRLVGSDPLLHLHICIGATWKMITRIRSIIISEQFHVSHPWSRHQVETFSALLVLCEGNPPFIDGFPSQRSVTRSFDDSFDLCMNKRLYKHPRRRWFETPLLSLLSHCIAYSLPDSVPNAKHELVPSHSS